MKVGKDNLWVTAPKMKRRNLKHKVRVSLWEQYEYIFFTLLSEEDSLGEYMDKAVGMEEGRLEPTLYEFCFLYEVWKLDFMLRRSRATGTCIKDI